MGKDKDDMAKDRNVWRIGTRWDMLQGWAGQ